MPKRSDRDVLHIMESCLRYIDQGKLSGLPQYVDVNESAVRKFVATLHANYYNLNQSNWVFDARGLCVDADVLVSGGILKEGNNYYKHELTAVGRELAKIVIFARKTT